MNRPSTAREALIVEALGEVARLLDRVESLLSSTDAGTRALEQADAGLHARLTAFEAAMSRLTQQAKVRTVEHILQRTGEATRHSIEAQTRAVNEAVRLACSEQIEPAVARLVVTLQRFIERAGRTWEFWLTHAATAISSAALTWWVATVVISR
jgi:hypothetical protein